MEPASIVALVIGLAFVGVAVYKIYKSNTKAPSTGSGDGPIHRERPPRVDP